MNRGVAGTAKMVNLGANQVLQEMRDLAQGSITARTSQVAGAIGVTNKDLEKFQGDAEAIFNFLAERMKAFTDLLGEYEDSTVGQFERLVDRWSTTTEAIVAKLAPMFKGFFTYLIDLTGYYVDDANNKLQSVALESGGRLDVWLNETAQSKYTEKQLEEYAEKVKKIMKENLEGSKIEGYVPKELPTLEGVSLSAQGDAAFQLSELFDRIAQSLGNIVLYTAQAADKLLKFVGITLDGVDPIEEIEFVIRTIIDYTEKLLEYCVAVALEFIHHKNLIDVILRGFMMIFDTLMILVIGLGTIGDLLTWIGDALGVVIITSCRMWWKMVSKVAKIYLEIYKYCVAIGRALSKIKISWNPDKSILENLSDNKKNLESISVGDEYDKLSSQYDSLFDKAEKAGDDVFGKLFDKAWNAAGESKDNILRDFGAKRPKEELSSADGEIYKAFTRFKRDLEKLKDGNTAEVGGNPNPEKKDGKKDNKAEKQAIKESQKIWKEGVEALKNALKDIVEEIKDAMAENETAYKRGLLTIDEYYKTKTQLDAIEKEERLKEAQAELGLLQNTLFDNPYDKKKEENKLAREIRTLTRELNKSIRVQEFAARMGQDNSRSMLKALEGLKPVETPQPPIVPDKPKVAGVSKEWDFANTVSKYAKELYGKEVPAWLAKGIFDFETGNGTSDVWKQLNNPGGVKYYGQKDATRGFISPEGDYYAKYDSIERAAKD